MLSELGTLELFSDLFLGNIMIYQLESNHNYGSVIWHLNGLKCEFEWLEVANFIEIL